MDVKYQVPLFIQAPASFHAYKVTPELSVFSVLLLKQLAK